MAGAAGKTTFKSIGIKEKLCEHLKTVGLENPTDVQKNCIPKVIAGLNVLAIAPTGSGKTLTFALPMVQDWMKDPYGIFGLVLSPTRELAIQIKEQFEILGGNNLQVCLIIGGADFQTQALELQKRPHFVVATPGRLADLGRTEGNPDLFKNVKYLVIDEADLMCSGRFDDDLHPIIRMVKNRKQTLFFSATCSEELQLLVSSFGSSKTFIFPEVPPDTLANEIKLNERVRDHYVISPPDFREGYLVELLRMIRDNEFPEICRSCIIFTATCKSCKLISKVLTELEFPNVALHSHLTQKDRNAALVHFKSKRVSILVATNVAGRGLDIPIVDCVINHDVPFPQDYVHRIGRTARAISKIGFAVTIVTPRQIPFLKKIEGAINKILHEFKVDEETVLKILTQVQAAVRTNEAKVEEEEAERDAKLEINKKKRKLEEESESSISDDNSAEDSNSNDSGDGD